MPGMVALRRMRQEGCKLEVSFSYISGKRKESREERGGERKIKKNRERINKIIIKRMTFGVGGISEIAGSQSRRRQPPH